MSFSTKQAKKKIHFYLQFSFKKSLVQIIDKITLQVLCIRVGKYQDAKVMYKFLHSHSPLANSISQWVTRK